MSEVWLHYVHQISWTFLDVAGQSPANHFANGFSSHNLPEDTPKKNEPIVSNVP